MRGVVLSYPGKRDISAILSEPSAPLLREVGERRADLFTHQDIRWLILGDNAKVLRALRLNPQIKGKVRLVYIDPPYATGQVFTYSGSLSKQATISRSRNGRIAYLDTLKGPEYLEFMRERLILMHDLLSNDGTIYVHIGIQVAPYVRILLNEIFGEEGFISEITRVKSNPKNFSRRAPGNVKDVILIYAKGPDYIWNEPHIPFTEEEVRRLFPKVDEEGRRYTTTPLHAPGETINGPTGMLWRGISPPLNATGAILLRSWNV
ncbi:MAG: site-specific DNA-methyltransferase [Bacteroidia bacterium]|nr:site-specific DNA-methyltransferase [Bacteroidia bacterium]